MSSLLFLLIAQSTAAARSEALPQPLDGSAASRQERANDDTRELNRIVYLKGGGAIRARARRADAGWEVRVDGQWNHLDDRVVDRVLLERDVLTQARELSLKLPKSDAGARVPYADWLLRAGLLEEGLAQLDDALALDPDQPQALALLASPPVPIRAPGSLIEDIDDAVRVGATAPRALQELAIVSLSRRPAEADLAGALQRALASHSPRIRTFAALGLRRTDPRQEIKGLLSRAVLDGSSDVRREAALTLRATSDEAVTLPVLRALGSRTSSVRENAIDALGVMGFASSIEPLVARLRALSSPQGSGGAWRAPASHIFVGRQMAYVQDFDVEVAQFASAADPQVNTAIEGSVLDVRVIGVSEMTVAVESRKLRGALRLLTGEHAGDTNRAWLEWWDKYQQRQRAPAAKTPPPATRGES